MRMTAADPATAEDDSVSPRQGAFLGRPLGTESRPTEPGEKTTISPRSSKRAAKYLPGCANSKSPSGFPMRLAVRRAAR